MFKGEPRWKLIDWSSLGIAIIVLVITLLSR